MCHASGTEVIELALGALIDASEALQNCANVDNIIVTGTVVLMEIERILMYVHLPACGRQAVAMRETTEDPHSSAAPSPGNRNHLAGPVPTRSVVDVG